MSDYPVVLVSAALGFFLGNAVRQVFDIVKAFLFSVKNVVNNVYSTALAIRDAGTVMVIESYETAVMLIRNVLDGVLVPIYNGVKDVLLVFKPVAMVVVAIMKSVIAVIHFAVSIVNTTVTQVSAMLGSIYGQIATAVNTTVETVVDYADWIYNGTDTTNSFITAIVYFIAIYIALTVLFWMYSRFMKKTK